MVSKAFERSTNAVSVRYVVVLSLFSDIESGKRINGCIVECLRLMPYWCL